MHQRVDDRFPDRRLGIGPAVEPDAALEHRGHLGVPPHELDRLLDQSALDQCDLAAWVNLKQRRHGRAERSALLGGVVFLAARIGRGIDAGLGKKSIGKAPE